MKQKSNAHETKVQRCSRRCLSATMKFFCNFIHFSCGVCATITYLSIPCMLECPLGIGKWSDHRRFQKTFWKLRDNFFRNLEGWTITTRQPFQILRAKFIPNWPEWPTIFAFEKDSKFVRISRSCGWKVDLIWPKCPPVQIQTRSQLGGGYFRK